MKQQILSFSIMIIASCFLLCGCTGRTERFLFEEAEDTKEQERAPEPAEETADGEAEQESPEQISQTEDPAAEIYVDVCGAVRSPGVYVLPEGSRIFGAIEAAGGFLETAAPEAVNQAGILMDAQQIYIPTKDEAAGDLPVVLSDGPDTESASGPDDGKIDLNTADLDQLCSLPGIGESKAEAILAYREQFGPFGSPEELMNVSGIKEGTYAKISGKIKVR